MNTNCSLFLDMLPIKFIIALLSSLYSAIGYDTNNQRLVKAKSLFDVEVETWSGKCTDNNVDFVVESLRRLLTYSFFVLLIIFSVSMAISPESKLVQIITYDAGATLIVVMFGFRTTHEFKEQTKTYIDWFFEKGISIGSIIGALYFLGMVLWYRMSGGIDILEGNHAIASSHLAKSVYAILIVTIGFYVLKILMPFVLSRLVARFVKYIVSKSYAHKGSTFGHITRYYLYFVAFIGFVEIIYLSGQKI